MADTSWLVLRGALDGSAPTGASPDIILGGAKPDPDYTKDYDKAFNRTGNYGHSNYVYVRAKNTGDDLAIGSVLVFAARVGSLQNQSEWVKLHTTDGRGSTNIAAEAGKVAVNGTPLIWEPGEAPPPDAPWCLIAELVGDGQPLITVPTTITDKAGFDTWIATQPRLAYVTVLPPKVVPVQAPTFGWQRLVTLDTGAATTLNVSLTCTAGPAGGWLAYSFDKPDAAGKVIGVGKTRYQLNTAYSQSRSVPAGYSGTVSVTYYPPADADGQAQFSFQVATESGGDDGGDLGTSTTTVVAQYTLSFGQTVVPS